MKSGTHARVFSQTIAHGGRTARMKLDKETEERREYGKKQSGHEKYKSLQPEPTKSKYNNNNITC